MKYFFVSDLHGLHPEKLKQKLERVNFKFGYENHTLCVGGDIIDGLNHNDILVDYIRELEKTSNVIAIKGNHEKDLDNKELSDVNKEWLENLPYTYENDHFILSHGMYITPEMVGMHRKNMHKTCAHGSPLLIGMIGKRWSGVSNNIVNKINETWKTIDEYEEALTKELFIGHFHDNKNIRKLITMRGKPERIKGKKQLSYGKINFIASNYEEEDIKIIIRSW